jgi:hypothetical protein
MDLQSRGHLCICTCLPPANDYFCLRAARECGLDVPLYRLAEDGMALVSTSIVMLLMVLLP